MIFTGQQRKQGTYLGNDEVDSTASQTSKKLLICLCTTGTRVTKVKSKIMGTYSKKYKRKLSVLEFLTAVIFCVEAGKCRHLFIITEMDVHVKIFAQVSEKIVEEAQ